MNTYPPIKITKREFYNLGGFSNPELFRKMISNKWVYYREPKGF